MCIFFYRFHAGVATNTTPYIFDKPWYLLPVQSPQDNPITNEGVSLGRRLFYDTILSGNQKQSCSSCHKQSLSFTDGEEISIGSLGNKAKRNSMSLINLGWQDKYFWDGRASSLEDLVHFPLTDRLEMNADTNEVKKLINKDKTYKVQFKKAFGNSAISMTLVSKALSQFLRTIFSYNSSFDLLFRDYFSKGGDYGPNMDDLHMLLNALGKGNEEKYGHNIYISNALKEISPSDKVITVFAKCLTCHYNSLQLICFNCGGNSIPEIAQVKFKNNGLEMEGKDKGLYALTGNVSDKYLYKVPTFRNLIFSAPYMHDGRYKTLEEVVDHYNNGILPNENLDPILKDTNNLPIRFNLNDIEKKQIIGLLKLFTDTSVISDPRFSMPVNPWSK